MQSFISDNAEFSYITVGCTSEQGKKKPPLLWAHGWGQSHHAFTRLAESLKNRGCNYLIDLPGFGESPPPPESWGTEQYADIIALWIKKHNLEPVIWIGHSFGCRVGLQLAAKYPECVSELCLIAGAGLKKKRPIWKKLYLFLRVRLFKILKKLLPKGEFKNKVMSKFGSTDYKNAAPQMRKIFIRVVNEDLSGIAAKIKCKVTLIYGKNDNETPPEFGHRFARLIPKSKLYILDGLDHYTILSTGHHQVLKIISDLINDIIKTGDNNK